MKCQTLDILILNLDILFDIRNSDFVILIDLFANQ